MAEWILIVTVLWNQGGRFATEWVEPMESYAVYMEAAAKWDAQRQVYNSLDFITTVGEARCWPRVYYDYE